jgi:5-carboxymethyl-2-hydroxymuconic-semialdehyde dehydrogenase/aminomuconate-semialdehyde/2-hydroxymuconate-6-semialdehyde dehydrogenase
MATASASLKKVGLELGGKSANIVLASADLDRAIDGSMLAIFAGNGEQCLAGSRIMVEDPVADEFIERFVSRVQSLRIGDPFDPATEIGPMAFAGLSCAGRNNCCSRPRTGIFLHADRGRGR